jgi:hypothetical protein
MRGAAEGSQALLELRLHSPKAGPRVHQLGASHAHAEPHRALAQRLVSRVELATDGSALVSQNQPGTHAARHDDGLYPRGNATQVDAVRLDRGVPFRGERRQPSMRVADLGHDPAELFLSAPIGGPGDLPAEPPKREPLLPLQLPATHAETDFVHLDLETGKHRDGLAGV